MSYLQQPRRFIQSSKLHRYFAYHCARIVRIASKDYTLCELMLALKDVVTNKKLFDPENPTIIICDDNLEDALDVKAFHVSETRFYLERQLEVIQQNIIEPNASPATTQTTLPTPDSLFLLPSWASPTATAVVARLYADANFDITAKYTAKPDFLKVLHSVSGVDPTCRVFFYTEITGLLSKYIMANKEKLFRSRNIKVCYVEDDLLGKAFGVRAFARNQVTSLLRSQLILYTGELPLSLPPPPPLPPVEEEDPYQEQYEVVSEPEIKPSQSCSDESDIDNVAVDEIRAREEQSIEADMSEVEDNVSNCTSVANSQCLDCGTLNQPLIKYCKDCWQDRKAWIPQRPGNKRKNPSQLPDGSKVPKMLELMGYSNSDLCTYCYAKPKNASFIHGQCAHQVCCYVCAKKIYGRKDPCPVCRRKIEKIIKMF